MKYVHFWFAALSMVNEKKMFQSKPGTQEVKSG